jgi:hypothetical protein
MANGALVGATCYDTQEHALDAYYSHSSPGQAPGASSYLSTFEKVSGAWHLRTYASQNSQLGMVSDAVAPVVAFPVCDTFESFKDGQVLGWGVVLAMVAAWCVANLRKGL